MTAIATRRRARRTAKRRRIREYPSDSSRTKLQDLRRAPYNTRSAYDSRTSAFDLLRNRRAARLCNTNTEKGHAKFHVGISDTLLSADSIRETAAVDATAPSAGEIGAMPSAVEATLQEVHDHHVGGGVLAEAERARRIRRACVTLGEAAGRPLAAIPASRAAIQDLCGPAAEGDILAHYESRAALREDRRLLYEACETVTHERARRRERNRRDDSWTPVLDRALTMIGGDAERRRLESIGLRALIDRARLHGLEPEQLTKDWIDRTVRADPSPRRRRALQCGARILRRMGYAVPERFRSSTPELPTTFRAHYAFFREEARRGRLASEHTTEREGGVGEKRLAGFDTAARYFVRLAPAAGIYAPGDDPPLSLLACPRTLWRVLEHQITLQAGPNALARDTAQAYFGALVIIFSAINPALAAERPKMMRLIRRKFAVGRRSTTKEAVALRLLEEADFEENLACLPWELRDEAEAILARAEGRALTRHEHLRAMQHGGVATMLYLNTFATVRISETLSLSRCGRWPSLRLSPDAVTINIPAEDMKNNVPFKARIDQEDADSLHEFLCWYEVAIRPLILRYSWGAESAARAHKFFPLDPRRAHRWFHRVTRTAFVRINPHLMRTLMVTLLLKDDAMTFEDAAALLGVSVATVRAYYAFVDTALRAARARGVASNALRAARQRRGA